MDTSIQPVVPSNPDDTFVIASFVIGGRVDSKVRSSIIPFLLNIDSKSSLIVIENFCSVSVCSISPKLIAITSELFSVIIL